MSIFRKKSKKNYLPDAKPEIDSEIPLVPKNHVKETVTRGSGHHVGAPTVIERATRKINRFNDMVNSFEKKALSCNLDGISKDIIEGEHLTMDIDKYINEPIISKGNLARYNRILEKYKNSIYFIEKKCKCKPS